MVKKIVVLCLTLVLPLTGLIMFVDGYLPAGAQNTSLAEAAIVQAPDLSLIKTVGTDPGICATNQTITLPVGGGEVTYCYKVTNTGDVTLARHTLVDDQLGTILTNFPYSLSPGASAFITKAAQITTTTMNVATWTGFNPGPVDVTSDTDTAVVVVTAPAPAIVLTKTVGTDPALCASNSTLFLPVGGGEVTYCYRVRNTGNITFSRHTLADDQLGSILTDFPYSLSPGASAFITQSAQITTTTINSATWTVSNPAPSAETAESTAVATVFVGYRLYLPVILRE